MLQPLDPSGVQSWLNPGYFSYLLNEATFMNQLHWLLWDTQYEVCLEQGLYYCVTLTFQTMNIKNVKTLAFHLSPSALSPDKTFIRFWISDSVIGCTYDLWLPGALTALWSSFCISRLEYAEDLANVFVRLPNWQEPNFNFIEKIPFLWKIPSTHWSNYSCLFKWSCLPARKDLMGVGLGETSS